MKKFIQSTLSAALSLLLILSWNPAGILAKDADRESDLNARERQSEVIRNENSDDKSGSAQSSDPETEKEEQENKKTKVPFIRKQVLDGSGKPVSVHSVFPGETATFVLTSCVPQNLFSHVTKVIRDNPEDETDVQIEGNYVLTFHDDLDEALHLLPDTFEVFIGNQKLEKTEYILDQKHEQHMENRTCDFHVALDLIQLFNSRKFFYDEINNAENITVQYQARLTEDPTPAMYENDAWVSYPGQEETLVELARLGVYGLKIHKVDAQDPGISLEGAKFELRKVVPEGSEETDDLVAATLVTDNHGFAQAQGLAAGQYQLVEVEAPENYVRRTDPIPVQIGEDGKGSDNYFSQQIGNTRAPSTGGSGSALFYSAGTGIVLLSLSVKLLQRRKKEQKRYE